MTERKIIWKSEGAKQAARDTRDVAKSQGEASTSAASMAKAAAGVTVAYTALKSLLVDSVKVFAEVDAVQGRIKRNFRQMGMSAAEAERELAKQNKTFRENAKFGLKISEQTLAYNELLDVTKDVTKAREDLALATDIQADKELDLAGAGDIVAQVRNGNIRGLQKLGVLTKDQVKDLNALTDESERTAIAMDLLRGEFAGAAEENAGLADELASNEANYERLQIAMGKVVAELGDTGAGLIGRTLDFVSASEEGTFTVNNFTTALENFASEASVARDNIGHFVDEIELADLPGLAANLGVFTEGGRERIQGIAARGQQKAAASGGGDPDGGSEGAGPSDGFVGPEFTAEKRIELAKAEQEAKKEAEREKQAAAKETARIQAEAEREAQQRWQAQQDRFAQARVERQRQAELAEQTAEREAQAAERAAERELAAQKKRDEQAKKWREEMRKDRIKRTIEQKKLEDEATKATIDAAEKAGAGALQAADMFIEGEGAKNVMKGVTHVAEAAGAVARGVTTYDPMQFVGAGLHIAAATKYFAAAGKAGQGGGGGGGAASAGAATTAGGGSREAASASVDPSRRRSADLAGSQEGGGAAPGGQTLVFQSLWPPTDQQVKDVRRLVDGSRRGEM